MPENSPGEAAPDRGVLKEQFDYATKQFFFIADQRMKTFHFYVIVVSAAVAATFQLTKEFDKLGYLSLSAAHVVIVAVFLIIERRNLTLLKTCKDALLHLEATSGWHPALCMATRDARESAGSFSTYRNAVKIAFSGQIVVAVMLFLYAVGFDRITSPKAPGQSNLNAAKNTATATKTVTSSGGIAPKDFTSSPVGQPNPANAEATPATR
jgi:hypothetical protein